jgi:hypothetical protein
MPPLQVQFRRIVERLKQVRVGYTVHSQNSSSDLAGALEEITAAVQQIEQRLQRLEKDKTP